MRYWPLPSVTAVRTFSISAGLVTSTVTPGRTAPDASLALPATVPSAWAPAADGRDSARRVRTTPNQARALSCIARSSACVLAVLGRTVRAEFRPANLFSICGWRLYARAAGLSRTSATDTGDEKLKEGRSKQTLSALSAFSASGAQKSNCALILAKRADRIDVGVRQAPPAMNAWL